MVLEDQVKGADHQDIVGHGHQHLSLSESADKSFASVLEGWPQNALETLRLRMQAHREKLRLSQPSSSGLQESTEDDPSERRSSSTSASEGDEEDEVSSRQDALVSTPESTRVGSELLLEVKPVTREAEAPCAAEEEAASAAYELYKEACEEEEHDPAFRVLGGEVYSLEYLEQYDAASLRRNLEVAISTIRELQKRLIGSNRHIERLTFERNQLRRESQRSQRGLERSKLALVDIQRAHEAEKALAIANAKLLAEKRLEEERSTLQSMLDRERSSFAESSAELSNATSQARDGRDQAERRARDLERELAATSAVFKEARQSTTCQLSEVERMLGAERVRAQSALSAIDASEAAFAAQKERTMRIESERTSLVARVTAQNDTIEKCRASLSIANENEQVAHRMLQIQRKEHAQAVLRMRAEIMTERNRATAADRLRGNAEEDLANVNTARDKSTRAHLGARRALEKYRSKAELDVSRAVDARREALDKVAYLEDKLRISEQCRSAAATQLKRLRYQAQEHAAVVDALQTKFLATDALRLKHKHHLYQLKQWTRAHACHDVLIHPTYATSARSQQIFLDDRRDFLDGDLPSGSSAATTRPSQTPALEADPHAVLFNHLVIGDDIPYMPVAS